MHLNFFRLQQLKQSSKKETKNEGRKKLREERRKRRREGMGKKSRLFFLKILKIFTGRSVGKESAWQCRRCKRGRLYSWVGKTLWRRKWPLALAECYSLWGRKESNTTKRASVLTHTHPLKNWVWVLCLFSFIRASSMGLCAWRADTHTTEQLTHTHIRSSYFSSSCKQNVDFVFLKCIISKTETNVKLAIKSPPKCKRL